MKQSTCPNQNTIPVVSFSPNRTLMFLSYNGNDIQIYLRKPCNAEPKTMISDITNEPNLPKNGSVLIRNPMRNNHIIAGYDPRTHRIYIHHKKRRYVVIIPSDVRLLYSGGKKFPV